MFTQISERAGYQVFQLVAAAKNFRPGKRSAGKVRLERLYEAALFLGLKVTLDGGGAGENMSSAGTSSRFELLKIENRTKRFYLGAERQERSKVHLGIFIEKRD